MSECEFDTILQEWAENEWEGYSDTPEFKTSKRHDRAMKRIFKLYDKNTRHLRPQSEIRVITIRRRIAVTFLVIILAVITGFTAAYFISRGFHGKVYSEYTELFPINTENCPEFIEEKYYLPELPEGFNLIESDSTPIYEHISYENKQTGQMITFEQWVKSEFDSIHFNTAKGELVEVEINRHNGVFLEVNPNCALVIWDNGDYILHIAGSLPKIELTDLAKKYRLKSVFMLTDKNGETEKITVYSDEKSVG